MINSRFKLDLRVDKHFFRDCDRIKCSGALFCYQANESHLQVAVVIPKKKLNLATQRNELRRKVFTAIEKNIKKIEAWQLSVAIVIVNPQQVFTDNELDATLLKCLGELYKQNEKNNN